MKMVRPVDITDDILINSDVPDSTETEWDSITTWIAGNIVYVAATHHEYEAISDNTDVYPPDDIYSETPKWLDLGATNKWRMFDNIVGSYTSKIGSIEVELSPGAINTIGIIDTNATTITVIMEDGLNTIYEKTINLALNNISNWYEFFFEPIIRKKDAVFIDLPVYIEATTTVTITGDPGESVKCGLCIPGYWRKLGNTQWGANTGIIDYSKKTVNEFGGYSIVKRAFAEQMDVNLFVNMVQIEETQRLLSNYRATPMLWIGSELHDNLITYGWVNKFSIVMQGPNGAYCSLRIEGLI